MSRWLKLLALILATLLALLAATLVAAQRWTGSDDFRQRLQQQGSAALGAALQLGQIEVTVWPLPAISVREIALATRPALTVQQVQLRPDWLELLRGRLALDTLVVRQAELSQQGVAAMADSVQKQGASAAPGSDNASALRWLPRRVLLQEMGWTNLQGQRSGFNAEGRFDAAGWPRWLSFTVQQGALAGTSLELKSQDNAGSAPSAWDLKLAVGGGTVEGPLRLTPPAADGAEFVLATTLTTHAVEVSALTAPSRALSGRLEASTRVDARWRSLSQLPEVMVSRTRFTVRDAVVHGIDLARAVSTAGLSRGGQTALDTLSGEVTTQGRSVQLHQLVARSGLLNAHGEVSITPAKALSGRISVDVGTRLVGVPLVLAGTLDAPEVTLTRAAMLGAAVGTAVLPGIGTGAGAKLGDQLGEGVKRLFGK